MAPRSTFAAANVAPVLRCVSSTRICEMTSPRTTSFRPTAGDLDNPNEVSESAIIRNWIVDPTSWDEEAQRVLGPFFAAMSLHSHDIVKRLPLSTTPPGQESRRRREALNDLLLRKKAGLSVRFAFEVNVHHDGGGRLTAIDIGDSAFERQLQEKIRIAIEDALHEAPPPPPQLANGQPFRSRWVFVATWFVDPPGCMLRPSDLMGAVPGETQLVCGMTETSSWNVQQRVAAELVGVTRLVTPTAP
jgi:hypothetical protein